MPLHMRMPKRGFRNIFANDFSEVNLNRIQKAIDDKRLKAGEKITEEVLRKAGLAHKSRDGVRLLGKGAITAKIDIEVAGASAVAPRKRSKRPAAASPPPSRRRSTATRRASRASARRAARNRPRSAKRARHEYNGPVPLARAGRHPHIGRPMGIRLRGIIGMFLGAA